MQKRYLQMLRWGANMASSGRVRILVGLKPKEIAGGTAGDE